MKRSEVQLRQSFLGSDASRNLWSATVAIVGLGGGGSHIAQQLAHVGIGRLQFYDPDHVELSNLNRLVGATHMDAELAASKTGVAKRLAEGVNPEILIEEFAVPWQQSATAIREADLIVSCLDTYAARQDIEATARRFLIPLVDIGMDVHLVKGSPHIAGQIIVSTPGGPCMKCLGFLTDENLKAEAELYGAAGGRPQVIWANGILASIAVGKIVGLLTGWDKSSQVGEYLHFDGNTQEVSRSPRLTYAPPECPHFPLDAIGEPTFL